MKQNSKADLIQKVPTLESEIEDYVDSLPIWSKYLAQKIYSGYKITEKDVEIAYKYFREVFINKTKGVSLAESVVPGSSLDETSELKELILSEIIHNEGVNALVENGKITFSPSLTIIYGVNGSGKTGYTRLLKKAFFARANEEILPDIKSPFPKAPSASFLFKAGGKEYTLVYPDDANRTEFKTFSVFDNKSVLVHLDEENRFEFRPAKLDLFSELAIGFTEVESKLQADINSRIERTFGGLFHEESEIKDTIVSITAKTSIPDIKQYLITDEDEEKATLLETNKAELLLLKKEKEIHALETMVVLINSLLLTIRGINEYCSNEFAIEIEDAISDFVSKQTLAKSEGIEKFHSETINSIGSEEWKSFIQAGDKLARLQVKNNYPEFGDSCLFCHQELTEEALSLISNYWSYLKSKAESESDKALAILIAYKNKLETLEFDLLPNENSLTTFITERNSLLHKDLINALVKQEKHVKNLIVSIQKKMINVITKNHKNATEEPDLLIIKEEPLTKFVLNINTEIEVLKAKDPKQELEIVEKEIIILTHRKQLTDNFSEIEEYINDLVLKDKEQKAKKELRTRGITDKEKELSKKYFGESYEKLFKEECSELHGNVSVDLTQRSEKGSSYKELKIAGKTPSMILSESEQKVISLSDFLAETRMSPLNRGIMFDDPVTSLDEKKKSYIAQRLVKESKNRQVIIFTHDLVFLSAIYSSCEDMGKEPDCHWIEAIEDKVGNIWLNNSPAFESKYKTSSIAQSYCDKSRGAAPQEREQKLKEGFSSLRTSYEALLIYDLFNGAVRRFDERVRFDCLEKVVFDSNLRDEVNDGFAHCCSHMEGHLHSDKYIFEKPSSENLQSEIDRFNTLKKKIKEFRKAAESST